MAAGNGLTHVTAIAAGSGHSLVCLYSLAATHLIVDVKA